MHPHPIRTAARAAALTSLLAPAALAQGQLDPAILTPYGTPCRASLDAVDTIGRNGHNLVFMATTARSGMPTALLVGLQKANTPLPASDCTLLVDPLISLSGVSGVGGQAVFPTLVGPEVLGTAYAQSVVLDPQAARLFASGGLEVAFPGRSPTDDPTTESRHACYYIQNLNWNYGGDGVPTVTGQVRWPSDSCNSNDGPPAGRPIVVFLHGNAMGHTDHRYLMAHLARNGYVTCSIANGGYLGSSNEGRARQAISYLNSMFRYWQWRGRLSGDVVFMGHSRGGEAALTAARLLDEDPTLGYRPYDVEAVVSIAPTDGGGDASDPRESLRGSAADSFLAIYGSKDPDVVGKRLEDPLVEPERTVFAIYDRAGSEDSVEGLLPPGVHVEKSMVWIHGATHRGFMDGCQHIEGGAIGCDTHHDIAKGYVLAFLRWQVEGMAAYREYFATPVQPAKVRIEEADVFTQLSDLPRRVVDNFEQGGLATSTIQGTVSHGSGIAQIAEGAAWQLDRSAPHDTRVARIKWSDSNTSWVRWSIPDRQIAFVGSARDVSRYDFLSLRVAQDYLDAWNTGGEDQDFYVRLRSASGYSTRVRISDFGRIPYPDPFIGAPFPQPFGDYSKTGMSTVRIPLHAFGNFDATTATWVYFEFTVPGHRRGSVIVDSLEFVD